MLGKIAAAKSAPCFACGRVKPADQVDLVRPGRGFTIESVVHSLRARAVIEREIADSRPTCVACLQQDQGVYATAQ